MTGEISFEKENKSLRGELRNKGVSGKFGGSFIRAAAELKLSATKASLIYQTTGFTAVLFTFH